MFKTLNPNFSYIDVSRFVVKKATNLSVLILCFVDKACSSSSDFLSNSIWVMARSVMSRGTAVRLMGVFRVAPVSLPCLKINEIHAHFLPVKAMGVGVVAVHWCCGVGTIASRTVSVWYQIITPAVLSGVRVLAWHIKGNFE